MSDTTRSVTIEITTTPNKIEAIQAIVHRILIAPDTSRRVRIVPEEPFTLDTISLDGVTHD